MILSPKSRNYFKFLQAKVSQGMARHGSRTPYLLDDDPIIRNYEIIHKVWSERAAINKVCLENKISRSQYYEKEDDFVRYGVLGLFPEIKTVTFSPDLERLTIMVSNARPSLSQQAILRVAEAVPITRQEAHMDGLLPTRQQTEVFGIVYSARSMNCID
jgi:hypothetical protein